MIQTRYHVTREWMSSNNHFPVHGCTKQCSILNIFGSTASKSPVSNSVTPSDQREEDFYSGSSGPSTSSGSIDVESASGDPSFINLDSTDSEAEFVVESSLGCTTDCSTSEECRRGLVNVTSENDQFQVSFEPAATCAASTRSDEIPDKFHPPCTNIQISKMQV